MKTTTYVHVKADDLQLFRAELVEETHGQNGLYVRITAGDLNPDLVLIFADGGSVTPADVAEKLFELHETIAREYSTYCDGVFGERLDGVADAAAARLDAQIDAA